MQALIKKFFRYWLPLYLYAGIIFYMSSLSHPLPKVSIPYFDKFLHLIEYGVFGILAARAFKNSPREKLNRNFIHSRPKNCGLKAADRQWPLTSVPSTTEAGTSVRGSIPPKEPRASAQAGYIILAIIASAAYAASDEFHQSFIPFRSCDAMDLTVDVIGGTIGAIFYGRYNTF